MNQKEPLAKINLYEKANIAFVNLITPEIRELNKMRKQNNY